MGASEAIQSSKVTAKSRSSNKLMSIFSVLLLIVTASIVGRYIYIEVNKKVTAKKEVVAKTLPERAAICYAHLRKGRVLRPSGSNSVECYKHILTMGNHEILESARFGELMSVLYKRSEQARKRGELKIAREYAKAMLLLAPEDKYSGWAKDELGL
ncbi:MAG: hypothetical protein HQL69_12340 [Magnetococcales bacterium]|nr:hypothetical protein [Magnetococcales bacterium]